MLNSLFYNYFSTYFNETFFKLIKNLKEWKINLPLTVTNKVCHIDATISTLLLYSFGYININDNNGPYIKIAPKNPEKIMIKQVDKPNTFLDTITTFIIKKNILEIY